MRRAEVARTVRALDELWSALVVVELNQALGLSASRLCDGHLIRGADAIHLASALVFAEGAAEIAFACWDRRRWEAAGELGLARVPTSLG
jgi:uncharacterized protein